MNLSRKPPKVSGKKIGFMIAAVIVIAGLIYFARSAASSSTVDRLGQVKKEDLIQQVTIAGIVEAERTTTVSAPYDGYVKKIFVKLTDNVKAGEPLVSFAQSLQATEPSFPIRAPFSGVVTQVQKSEGQFLKAGDAREYVLRLDDRSKMYVKANAPEMDVVKLKPGLEATVRVSAILDHTYKGVVESIAQASTVQEQWGGRSQVNFTVKIQVTNPDETLKPGMSSIIDIVTNKKPAVLTLAHEFIQKDGEKYYVTMKDNKRREIQVGAQNESAFEIKSGLNAGEEVKQIDFLKLIEDGAKP